MYDLNGDHDEPPNERRQPIASEESSDHDPAEQRPEFLRQRRGGPKARKNRARVCARARRIEESARLTVEKINGEG